MRVRVLLLALVCAGLACTGLAQEAAAHALLRRASPANGSTVAPPPAVITLRFASRVEPKLVHLDVTRDGSALAGLDAPGVSADGRVVTQALPSPAPGAYALHWSVVAIDGHRTEGDLAFTAKP